MVVYKVPGHDWFSFPKRAFVESSRSQLPLDLRSMQGQIKFMKEVVPWLDQEDVIEKYAWCLEYDMRRIFCGIFVVGTGGEL